MGIRGRPSKNKAPQRFNKLTEEEYLNRALQTPGQLSSAEWKWAFETLKQIRASKRLEANSATQQENGAHGTETRKNVGLRSLLTNGKVSDASE